MRSKGILLIGVLLLVIAVSGCTSTNKEFKVGNSTFQISGDFEETFNSEGAELAERIRIDSNDKSIIVTQYHDIELYQVESKNAVDTKTINGTECKFIPGAPAVVWFEKNDKYYQISVQGLDSEKNWIEGTSEDVKYIEEIINTLNS